MKKAAIFLIITTLFFLPESLTADMGKQAYDRLCSSCHGAAGTGDGPVGKALPPGLLPDLTTTKLKFATDDDKMKDLIIKGGAAAGLSPIMPPHPGIQGEELDALIAYTKSLMRSE